MPPQLNPFAPPGPWQRPGVSCPQTPPAVHPWKTASGGSQPGRSSFNRWKAASGLRLRAFRGRNTEGQRDADNRLVAVNILATGHRSEFGYDGMGRRVVIRELDPTTTNKAETLTITSNKTYLWDGVEIAQERDSTGSNVYRRFFAQGFVDTDGTVLFYTRDHLGSIRELTDEKQSLRARYDYDSYGCMTKASGDRETAFGFTRHFWHAPSGLNLTCHRAYDSNLGLWISRDPIGEIGGVNLYNYVLYNSIINYDSLGLAVDSAGKECDVCQMTTINKNDLTHSFPPHTWLYFIPPGGAAPYGVGFAPVPSSRLLAPFGTAPCP